MERTEEEPLRTNDNDDTFTSIHWLWAHISSQLIYFVLLQYARFPNIVSTLYEKVKERLPFWKFILCASDFHFDFHKRLPPLVAREKSATRSRLFDVVIVAIHFGQHTTESGKLLIQRWIHVIFHACARSLDFIVMYFIWKILGVEFHVRVECVWHALPRKRAIASTWLYKNICNETGTVPFCNI